MTSKANLSNRTQKARDANRFSKVLTRTRDGKVNTVLVAGTQAKHYHVILRRVNAITISTECRLQAGSAGYQPCQGNIRGTVCYHSFVAVLKAAGKYKVSFCANHADSKRLANIHNGIVGRLISHQGPGTVYFVVHNGKS